MKFKMPQIEGSRTGEQTLRWSVFLTTLFCVLVPTIEHCKFGCSWLDTVYQNFIFYVLPMALFLVLIHGPSLWPRNLFLFFLVFALMLGAPLCLIGQLLTYNHKTEEVVEKVSLRDCDVAVIHYVEYQGDYSVNGVRLVLQSPILGLARGRRVLMDVTPASVGHFDIIENGRTIRFQCRQNVGNTAIDLHHDFDTKWNGARNSKIVVVEPR